VGIVQKIRVVVPCFNESDRLDGEAFLAFAQSSRFSFLFVDDGSVDGTGDVLHGLASSSKGDLESFSLLKNRGKGEAVRQGLVAAIADGAEVVGYLDAYLSTLEALEKEDVQVALGSRVSMMGRQIKRRPHRHYLGRVFASMASLMLRTGFYDTQCGAKLFRVNGALKAALAEPFMSRWVFDVELIGRLLIGNADQAPLDASAFVEVPLHAWRDVPGSKMSSAHMARAALEMAQLARVLDQRRQKAQP
jgi:glycosyltransferase involved in cell wall biosynthesis